MPITPVTLLRESRTRLSPITAMRATWPKIVEWWAGTKPLIAKHFSEHLAHFEEVVQISSRERPDVVDEEKRRKFSQSEMAIMQENDGRARQAKASLLALIDAVLRLEDVEPKAPGVLVSKRVETAAEIEEKTRVFVVHGHDEAMLQSVARVLETVGLVAVILNEQENEGKTIIEKFEKHAQVRYAVVLLSPDDTAYLTKLGPKEGVKVAKPRARQNVVLELGYFVGKLGRSRVTVLQKGDLEAPSDISGVVYVTFDGNGGWELKMCKELRAAGYPIDLNKL